MERPYSNKLIQKMQNKNKLTSLTQSWAMESTSYSFSRLIPYLAQNNRTFLSEKPLVTPGKFCLRISLTCLYLLLSSLIFTSSWETSASREDYDENCMPNFTFYRQVNIRRRFSLALFKPGYFLQNSTPGEFAHIKHSDRVKIIALKFHRPRSDFLSDVFAAVVVVVS